MDFSEYLNAAAGSMLLLSLGAIFLLGIVTAIAWMTYRRRRLGTENQRRGRRAEMRAARLLEKEGFTILDTQPQIKSELMVNGDICTFFITPDILVEKDGVRYLVEVKHFNDRSGITNASIRRQVMEYLHATDYPCLLVRMPEGDIDLIEKPGAS